MQSLQDRMQIQDLSNLYAYYVDEMKIEEWVNCFTADAVFDESDLGNGTHIGHEAIRAFGERLVTRVQLVVHLMSNHLVWDLGETDARGSSVAVVEAIYANGDRYRNHCSYADRYLKVDGTWKIKHRVAKRTFAKEFLGNVMADESA